MSIYGEPQEVQRTKVAETFFYRGEGEVERGCYNQFVGGNWGSKWLFIGWIVTVFHWLGYSQARRNSFFLLLGSKVLTFLLLVMQLMLSGRMWELPLLTSRLHFINTWGFHWLIFRGGNAKWCSHFAKWFSVSFKVKHTITIEPSSLTPGYLP